MDFGLDELTGAFEKVAIPGHGRANLSWHDSGVGQREALVSALRTQPEIASSAIWCAGEASAMQAVRTFLFKELAVPRGQATVRGYWKVRNKPEPLHSR